MSFTRRCLLATVALAVVAVGAACSPPPADEVLNTVGVLPEPDQTTTLLPVIIEESLPPDDGTAPPGALFEGDFCAALTEADLSAVSFAGLGRAQPAGDPERVPDGCSFPLQAGDAMVLVVVTARSQAQFAAPGVDAAEIDELTGIGEAARGVNRGELYEVYVKVGNGWFSVLAPDPASATALARRAAPRADQA